MFDRKEILGKVCPAVFENIAPVYLTFLRLRDGEDAGEVLATTSFEFGDTKSVADALNSFLDYAEKLAMLHGYGETFALYARQDTPDDLALDDARPDSNTLAIDGEEPLAVVQTDGEWEGAQ